MNDVKSSAASACATNASAASPLPRPLVGAEVTKVESAAGDGVRTLPGDAFGSYSARSFNTGKSSRVLNLREPAGRVGLDGPTLRARFPSRVIALVEAWTLPRPREPVLARMRELQIPCGNAHQPEEALTMIRALRPGAVSQAMPSGERVPTFPALFDGRRLPRSATPLIGGPRRPF